MRGYASLLILEELMRKVGDVERDLQQEGTKSSFNPCKLPAGLIEYPRTNDRFLPCHYFDTIIGTSTGGLIAIMLARLRMTVSDAKEQYKALGGSIFGSPRSFPFSIFRTKYHNKEAINAFKQVTHDYDASLDEVHGFANAPFNKLNFGVCKTIVTALGEKCNPQGQSVDRSRMFLFQSYDSPVAKQLGESVRKRGFPGPVWLVAQAATAAATYFDPLEIQSLNGEIWKFKDAGIRVNNPTEIGLDKLRSWGPNKNSDSATHAVVSIGTGVSHSSTTAPNWTKHLFGGMVPTVQEIVDESLETEEVHKRVEQRLRLDNDKRYWRFNDSSPGWDGIKLDHWDTDSLERMEGLIEQYLEKDDVQRELRECAERLVKTRRERTHNMEKWERFAKVFEFVCTGHACFKPKYQLRGDFKSHQEREHPAEQETESPLEWTYDGRKKRRKSANQPF